MTNNRVSLLAVGDLIFRGPKFESYFEFVSHRLKSADIVLGQGEVPFTNRSIEKYYLEVPTEFFAGEVCEPANMSNLVSAGFNIITLAGNHLWDGGVPGIIDTIEGLNGLGIATVGAGMNINEARRPVLIEKKGTRFGVLDYNCVGPKLSWATPEKPGCAYIHITTAYELEHPTPGGNPTIFTSAEPTSMNALIEDIQKLRPVCDILIVCFHMGIGFTPVTIAQYEKQVSHTAIDYGSDIVLGNHAHMLRGIEFYKNKPIFYGLNHFVLGNKDNHPTSKKPVNWATQNFMKKANSLFGPYFIPGYHPDALMTIIAKFIFTHNKIEQISYIPCLINEKGQPVILENDERGQQVFNYMERITGEESLNAAYQWGNDEILIFQQ